MSELLIHVDEQDNEIGPIERREAHLGDGMLHRGLIVIVKNQEGKILLTQRSMTRPDLTFPPPFPGFWDVTMAGHPKWGQNGYISQMIAELNEELGLTTRQTDIEFLGKFQYHTPDPTYPNPNAPPGFRLSEWEICGFGLLRTTQDPKINETELTSSKWVEGTDVTPTLATLKAAPWASILVRRFPEIFC